MIKIYTENISQQKVSESVLSDIKKIIRKTASQERPELKLECTVTFCDNEYIRELNSQYRGVDSATDVLSFPMFDFDTPEVVAQLGDIVISVERAEEQAELYGHSFKREICFLALHGALHLFGYDHIEESDRVIMEKRQREILDEMGITRE